MMKQKNADMTSLALANPVKRKYPAALIRENVELYLIMLPVLVLIFIFCYIPLYGVIISFQDYTPGMPFLSFTDPIKWVGIKHFKKFIDSIYFGRLMSNTILLSVYNLAFGFWIPIIFALVLNEVKALRFKKFIQTASYLPYFISSVVVAGMVLSFIQVDGLVNNVISAFGGTPAAFRNDPNAFPFIYTFTNIWKSFGFNAILYLSSIAAIDPSLYESARLDGAKRLQLMRYITIPGIKPTIAIMFIMAVGSILSSNTDLILLLYNPATYITGDVIGTYVYRLGIQGGQFSYTTAIGLFAAVINFVLVFVANKCSDKFANYSLW
ncbi:MAG: ABC transporter permease subunit [Clostridiaceae bacterium]|nr:ABC transporter permease subunit [Clostridiaceae bacterium]